MAYISFQPSDYFTTKLYTGNGGTNNVTGVGFDPDFSWFKSRAVEVHELYDKVRGAGKRIQSQSTAAQNDEGYQSFITDGFAWSGSGNCNANTVNYVSWNWKANGQGSANSDGSITSTYTSANTTSGFSIVSYTGTGSNATVGHGLGIAPKIVLIKDLSATASWRMFTEMTGNESQLALDQTSAADSGNTSMWNSTSPTTTTFSIGTHGNVNTSSNNYIAYCFAEKKGFSKFGEYVGNGSADGTFVYTGFKPAFVLSKVTNNTQGWFLVDNRRANPYNPVDGSLHPNSNAAEDTASDFFVDFTSNGFKLKDNDLQLNGSGANYIFMAFAEHPLVSSNDIPATAR